MAIGQITLTQYDGNIAYCRMATTFDPTGTYTQLDTEATTIAGTPFNLWADATDILYVGKSTTFAYLGFRFATTTATYATPVLWYSITSTQYAIATATAATNTITITGDYTAKFKAGYQFRIAASTGNNGIWTCNADSTVTSGVTSIVTAEDLTNDVDDGNVPASSIWGPLTAQFNNTSALTANGYVAWSIPVDWGLSSITNTGAYGTTATSAYWIKATVATATGDPSTVYNLLRNVTLVEPLHVYGPEDEYESVYADINGALHKKDMTYKGPSKLTIGITQIACTYSNFQLLQDWKRYRNRIYIQDEAVTSPPWGATLPDSYYRIMEGYLVHTPPEMMAVGKMPLEPGAYYPLIFKIDTIVTQSSLLGVTL